MCDHIALMHKSNKVLDGKLIDIKRAFRTNTYEIGIETPDDTFESKTRLHADVMNELSDSWEVTPAHFKTINENDLKIKVKIPENQTSNNLLSYLS